MRRVELLAEQMDDAYAILRRCIDGVTDEDFTWEPGDHVWRVFRETSGRWTHDYGDEEPQPPPFTTIGWRLTHLATCKVMYHEYAFGPRVMRWDTLETPHDVHGTITMLELGHTQLMDDVRSITDEDLDAQRLTNWGEPWPTWRIFWTMTHHDLQHGGEIGALLDLRRLGAPGGSEGRR